MRRVDVVTNIGRPRRPVSKGGLLRGIGAGAVVVTLAACSSAPAPEPAPSAPSAPATTAVPEPTPSAPAPTPTFDRAAQSLDDPASRWVIVNKSRPLAPSDFAPADLVQVDVPHTNAPRLRQEAADAVVRMFDAASQTGVGLVSLSAYRSFDTQTQVYGGIVAANGQASADTISARPGFSEHQTGWAIDIGDASGACHLAECFRDTAGGVWVAAEAWRYGFVLRYPDGGTPVTGYTYEPWHFRYVGPELAAEMHDTGSATLEEFFGLPAAPDYTG